MKPNRVPLLPPLPARPQCAYLEASGCQKESRYLGVLQRLQETQGLDAAQKGVVRGLVEDALQGDPAGSLQKAALG